MVYGDYWIALALALAALIVSLRTQRRLQAEVKRLEQLIGLYGQMAHTAHTKLPDPAVSPHKPAFTQAHPWPVTAEGTDLVNPGAAADSTHPLRDALPPPGGPLTATHSADSGQPLEPDEQSLRIVTSMWHSLQQWFKGGNAIVRIGVLVLLVGVVLLLRLANELFSISIEMRLGAVVLGGVGLTLLGLRLRQKRRGYAVSVQGAGLAMVYFSLFAAYRLYAVLPAGLTFGLLAVLAVVTATLSLLQNAFPLAVLAFGGAFLAPLLTATDSHNLVGLFGYYLVLNSALAWMAHYKTWKVLNTLGVLMTFGVAGLSGWNSYEVSMRWPLEGLLLAHLGLYLFMVVRYSQQLVAALPQPPTPQGSQPAMALVDSTLLFGVPVLGFALQAGLMHDIPYALALSSGVLSAIYLLLGYQLFYRHKNLVLLTEGVLALGVGFMALVIPLALDGRWTAMGWAVQGAALVWLGKRQGRRGSVRFGLLLLALTALSIGWVAINQAATGLPLLVYTLCLWLVALLLREPQTPGYAAGAQPALPVVQGGRLGRADTGSFIALLAALIASQFMLLAWAEWMQARHYYWPFNHLAMGFYPLLFALGSLIASWRLEWRAAARVQQLILAWLTLFVGLLWLDVDDVLISRDASFTVSLWLLALGFSVFGALLMWRSRWPGAVAATGPLAVAATLRFERAVWLMGVLILASALGRLHWTSQPLLAMVVAPLGILIGLLGQQPNPSPILAAFRRAVADIALPLAGLFFCWMMLANAMESGQMLGLPYIPVLNGLDIGLVLSALVVYWLLNVKPAPFRRFLPINPGLASTGFAGFMIVNGMVIRTLHQWAGTPLATGPAWNNDTVQTAFTLVWTLCALALTGLASRYAWRSIWICGVLLLAIVVAKLLFIDLSHAATLARIISFIGAGLVMLLIGYIAPLPPARLKPDASPLAKPVPQPADNQPSATSGQSGSSQQGSADAD